MWGAEEDGNWKQPFFLFPGAGDPGTAVSPLRIVSSAATALSRSTLRRQDPRELPTRDRRPGPSGVKLCKLCNLLKSFGFGTFPWPHALVQKIDQSNLIKPKLEWSRQHIKYHPAPFTTLELQDPADFRPI